MLAMNRSAVTWSGLSGIVVTAVVSIVVSVVTAWLIFELVKKREIAEGLRLEVERLELVKKPELEVTLRNEIERQRKTIELEQAREKENRVREEVLRWANPILGAVQDLYDRLNNILFGRGIAALHPEYTQSGWWSVSYDYFMYSTLYYFGVYFAYALALRNSLSFELFQDQEEKDELFRALHTVIHALSGDPPPHSCSGLDYQVFSLEQRSMGSVILRRSDGVECISYPEFREKLNDEKYAQVFLPLKKLVESLTPSPDDWRWDRLNAVYKGLAEVNKTCHNVLRLPAE